MGARVTGGGGGAGRGAAAVGGATGGAGGRNGGGVVGRGGAAGAGDIPVPTGGRGGGGRGGAAGRGMTGGAAAGRGGDAGARWATGGTGGADADIGVATARAMIGVGALLIVSGGGVGMPARGVNSSAAAGAAPSRLMAITPPQTAHRARTDVPGILAGSMRKTDRHSGQETFTNDLAVRRPRPRAAGRTHQRPSDRCADRWRRPSRGVSWRSSSFPWRVRSPALHA